MPLQASTSDIALVCHDARGSDIQAMTKSNTSIWLAVPMEERLSVFEVSRMASDFGMRGSHVSMKGMHKDLVWRSLFAALAARAISG